MTSQPSQISKFIRSESIERLLGKQVDHKSKLTLLNTNSMLDLKKITFKSLHFETVKLKRCDLAKKQQKSTFNAIK